MNTICTRTVCTAINGNSCDCTAEKYEKFLDKLWLMGKDLKTDKDLRDLGQNMRNRIRKFSKMSS